MSIRIVLVGPPASGKGTQANVLSEGYAVPKISTGDMLREAKAAGTALGKEAEKFMTAGKLVPDEVVIGLVDERLNAADAENGFILDGFPRTTAQAEAPASTGPQQFRLANGLTVIVKPDHRAPTAVQMLWVRAGAYDEVDGTSGVAHVLEHMMFKGTAKLKPGEFSRQVALLGGRENAFTSYDHTGYYQQVPAGHLPDVMALESDRFAHNQWSDDEFAKELEVVKEERRMRTDDNPRALLREQLYAAAFVASPYHRPVVGWMGDLDSLQADDVRHFWQRWYVPAIAALVVAGDVEPKQVLAWAEKTYGGIPARAVPERKPRPEPKELPKTS